MQSKNERNQGRYSTELALNAILHKTDFLAFLVIPSDNDAMSTTFDVVFSHKKIMSFHFVIHHIFWTEKGLFYNGLEFTASDLIKTLKIAFEKFVVNQI